MIDARNAIVRGAVFCFSLIVAGLMGSEPASAHKLKVFASAVGNQIQGSAYFAGGGKAGGASISIQDDEGRTLAEIQPDENGGFSYIATAPSDYLVVARSPDGHQATWRVSAAELAPAFPTRGDPEATTGLDQSEAADDLATILKGSDGRQGTQKAANAASQEATASASVAQDPQLLSAIELAVARQIAPLREQLAASEGRARLTDVLGGIGYIIGVTGLALWWKSRRRSRDTS